MEAVVHMLWRGICQKSQLILLGTASALVATHYICGELWSYPEVNVWKERAFWSDMLWYAVSPFVLWSVWSIISLARLKTEEVIIGAASILFLGDILVYLFSTALASIRGFGVSQAKLPLDYWYWRTCWLPAVFGVVNIVALYRWCALFELNIAGRRCRFRPQFPGTSLLLKMVALVLGCTALIVTGIHFLLPEMPLTASTSDVACQFLVPSRLKKNFCILAQNQACYGKHLRAVLAHVELAELQRYHFYMSLDDSTFADFILNPSIDVLPLQEIAWRRMLWEYFYPRVRNENNPLAGAQIVARHLRERVGIDSSYSCPVGVETIWTQGMADDTGFERIYVAALRSVGIAACLPRGGHAQIWTGKAWEAAPRPPAWSGAPVQYQHEKLNN